MSADRPPLDHLIACDGELHLALSEADFAEIAELAFRLAQERVRRAGGLLTPVLARSFGELGEVERAGIARMVEDVIRALILLEYMSLQGT